MAFCKKQMVLFYMVVMAALSVCMGGSEYIVGDDHGWNPGFNYTAWAEHHNIKVHDTIVFKYKKGEHNVVQASLEDFNLCTATSAEKNTIFDTGNDKFNFNKNGHYYYYSSVKDDCKNGMRITIRVAKPDDDKQKPSPSPKSSPVPPVPELTPPPPSVPAKTPPKETAPAPAPEKKQEKSAAVSVSSLSVVGIMAIGLAALFGGLAY